jgi:hypothetical protein
MGFISLSQRAMVHQKKGGERERMPYRGHLFRASGIHVVKSPNKTICAGNKCHHVLYE